MTASSSSSVVRLGPVTYTHSLHISQHQFHSFVYPTKMPRPDDILRITHNLLSVHIAAMSGRDRESVCVSCCGVVGKVQVTLQTERKRERWPPLLKLGLPFLYSAAGHFSVCRLVCCCCGCCCKLLFDARCLCCWSLYTHIHPIMCYS